MAEGYNHKEDGSSPHRLFKIFFRIGLFTFGGGYTMIPVIEKYVVDRNRWIDREEFLDLIALAQSCPGVFAINISTFIGYKLHKTNGALYAALGAALPSFLIILAIAAYFHQFRNVEWVAACFNGIRPAVVALIAAPTFSLAKSAGLTLANCWIPAASALLIWLLGVNPVYIIIAAGVGGYVYGMLSEDDNGYQDGK
ncbi:chromate transporter [Palleniella muris]|uniref:Chromate transporter n=1 Tax=Palleniella muris TaxID=3038145 RepID=A0AC61QUV0_9BACT|nr:chromate transporter [Palleniella muris]TGX84063.1 chromate transporter [Palleniella muris]